MACCKEFKIKYGNMTVMVKHMKLYENQNISGSSTESKAEVTNLIL